jgi:superkiller protein 3
MHYSAQYMANRASALLRLSPADEALSLADYATALNLTLPRAWSTKADVLYALGRYEDAVRSCERALVLDPALLHARRVMSHAQLSLKRPLEARDK